MIIKKEKVISKIISQRPSLDFKKSEKFYEENENEFYLLKRDEKIIPENSSCYIHVNDIDAVFFTLSKSTRRENCNKKPALGNAGIL